MPRAPADDREFYDYIVSQYATERERLADTVARAAPASEVAGARTSVYILALALVTYGRLDVIADVLDNMLPPAHPTNRALAHEIKALIPIPPHLHAGTSPSETLEWIRAHASRLALG